MVQSTIIIRLDHLGGSILVEVSAPDTALVDATFKMRKFMAQITPTSPRRAEIDFENYTACYIVSNVTVYMAFCDRSYPKAVAFKYLEDIQQQFSSQHPEREYAPPVILKGYPFMSFENDLRRTMREYSDPRAFQDQGILRINEELKNVTEVMKKNIDDLLTRGDSLDKMTDISSHLLQDSRKFRKAAVRMNWELLLKQYGPIGGVALIVIVFIWWRFF